MVCRKFYKTMRQHRYNSNFVKLKLSNSMKAYCSNSSVLWSLITSQTYVIKFYEGILQ